ncbi:hypothetical protein II898_01060 [bacterium]|nr:hypothetical protein [bacterium]
MKKLLLFFTVFLFFGFLSAEDVKTGEYDFGDITVTLFEEREPEAEKARKEAEEKEKPVLNEEGKICCCDIPDEKAFEPKKFYIQPALGFGTGLSLYRFTAALDADFLVARREKINYYVGLDIDARFSYYIGSDPREIAVQANVVFDFLRDDPNLRSASLWISAGIDLIFIRDMIDGDYEDYVFEYSQAWGLGVDMIFKNYVVLKLGIDGLVGIWPDLTIAVGYRF